MAVVFCDDVEITLFVKMESGSWVGWYKNEKLIMSTAEFYHLSLEHCQNSRLLSLDCYVLSLNFEKQSCFSCNPA